MKFIRKEDFVYFSYIDSQKIFAGCTTKIGYKEAYSDNRLNINTNRNSIMNALYPDYVVHYLLQNHSDTIYFTHDADYAQGVEGDGLITLQAGEIVCVTVADCGSVVFFDKNCSLAAVVHCGWRGLQAGIIPKMISRLKLYASPSELTAIIGPHIHQNSYEVGSEFYSMFNHKSLLLKNGNLYFSQNHVITEQLVSNGITTIFDCNMNTFSLSSLFFSHRNNAEIGRMFVFAGIKKGLRIKP
ncbi:MAG: polyphenol oxidase family protein [Bacteroidales bacterium]